MFVRWKRRTLRRSLDTTLHAVLMRSVRVAGRPRQQTVCYLAAIRAQYQHAPAHRQAFWRQVDERLATLPLDATTRQRVETTLASTIPRPTAAEVQQVVAQQALLEQLVGHLAGPPASRPGGEGPLQGEVF